MSVNNVYCTNKICQDQLHFLLKYFNIIKKNDPCCRSGSSPRVYQFQNLHME